MNGVKAIVIGVAIITCAMVLSIALLHPEKLSDSACIGQIVSGCILLFGASLLIRRSIQQLRAKPIPFLMRINFSRPFEVDTHITGLGKLFCAGFMLYVTYMLLKDLLQ